MSELVGRRRNPSGIAEARVRAQLLQEALSRPGEQGLALACSLGHNPPGSRDFSGPAGSGILIYFLFWQPRGVGSDREETQEPHDFETLRWHGWG